MMKNKPKKKILIVDDDTGFLSETWAILVGLGYDVETITTGQEFAAKVKSYSPDCILLDLKLGAISGFSLALELRNDPVSYKIPIIAVTGFYSSSDCRGIAQMCNMKECLSKPLDPDGLVKAIKALTS